MKKIICILLSLMMLLMLCTLPSNIFADTPEPSTIIKAKNVAFEDTIYLLFYATFENVPQGAETGVMAWNNAADAQACDSRYEYATKCDCTNYVHPTYGAEYAYKDLAAKNMTDDLYVRSYIKDGDHYTFSPMIKYSVLQYACNRLAASKDDNFKSLLHSMLDYGTAAQLYFSYKTERLANGTYFTVSLDGGTLEDGTTSGLFQMGDSPMLRADTVEGLAFSHWQDSNGSLIGREESSAVEVMGSETYKAVYAESRLFGTTAEVMAKDRNGNYVSSDCLVITSPGSLITEGARVAEIGLSERPIVEIALEEATSGRPGQPIVVTFEGQIVTVKCGDSTVFEADLTSVESQIERLVYDGKTVKAIDSDGRILEEYDF